MSDDPGNAGTEPPDDETHRILSLDDLHSAVAELTKKVDRVLSGGAAGPEGGARAAPAGRPATRAETGEDRRREIRDELTALRAQEKSDAAREELTGRVGKIERERAAERKPKELRRVERIMGWGS